MSIENAKPFLLAPVVTDLCCADYPVTAANLLLQWLLLLPLLH
jgi:hypothetical protein